MNASKERLVSECCTVFFCSSVLLRFFYHQHFARWSGLFNYLFVMPNIGGGGGGVENIFGGVDILFGGVIANIGGGG